jgi:hypothetical protein
MKTSIAAVFLVLLAAGCSGDGGHEANPYSAHDLAWIKRLNRWHQRYGRQEANIQPVYTRALETRGDLGPLRNVLRPYRQCARSLRTKVGEPEHEQLRRAYPFLLEACDKDQRFARALLRSAGPNPGYPSSDQFRKSDWPFHQAFQLIEAGLIASRSLPVRGGQTDESRVEPRLSQAASTLTRRQIEVRCWSARDWSPIIKEWHAYEGTKGDAGGFASGSAHANISPSRCATLARFLYDDWRPADRGGVEALADTVALVAHEVEHLYEAGAGEAETECHAVQDVRGLASALGASSSYASKLARVYWRDLYPSEPAEYRSEECRRGGGYDRHPETRAFPSG